MKPWQEDSSKAHNKLRAFKFETKHVFLFDVVIKSRSQLYCHYYMALSNICFLTKNDFLLVIKTALVLFARHKVYRNSIRRTEKLAFKAKSPLFSHCS